VGVAIAPGATHWHAGTLTYTTAGLVVLFFWLLWGDFAWSMKERSVGSVVQLLLRKFHASDTTMALLLGSLPAVIGVVLGPVISYRSDRHRGPRGRRIPYLIITTPIAALSMVGLAFSPAMGRGLRAASGGGGALSEDQWILIFFGLFWTLFELATVAANAVFGALINDVVPRPLLGRFYGMFRALSLIAGMIFNFWLLGKAETHYVLLFIGIGTLYGIGFAMMCLKVREGQYPPPPELPVAASGAVTWGGEIATARLRLREHSTGPAARHLLWTLLPPAVRAYALECFTNPYYLWVFLAINLSMVAFVPVNLFSIPYSQSLGITTTQYGRYLALTYAISLALSYFLGSMADRFHPLRVGMVTLVLYAGVTLFGSLFSTHATAFAVALVAHGVLSGTYFTSTASIGQRLFPQSKFATLASAAGILGALFNVVVPGAMGWYLDRTNHAYRYTFAASCILSVLGFLAWWVVYRKFVALGGPHHYVAPGGDEADRAGGRFPVVQGKK
jgi:MFS family permease